MAKRADIYPERMTVFAPLQPRRVVTLQRDKLSMREAIRMGLLLCSTSWIMVTKRPTAADGDILNGFWFWLEYCKFETILTSQSEEQRTDWLAGHTCKFLTGRHKKMSTQLSCREPLEGKVCVKCNSVFKDYKSKEEWRTGKTEEQRVDRERQGGPCRS